MNKDIVVKRAELVQTPIDTEERTLIIGFNEPKFRELQTEELDSKLNARLVTYFLPAVLIARMQKKRPRFFISSGLNMALKWNARNDEQKAIMIANNALKIDFLKTFFETFFPNDFSLIECIVAQDVLKVPEEKFLNLWKIVEKKYHEELKEVRFQLSKFLHPKQFNTQTYDELTPEQKEKLEEVDASIAFKYAIGHSFVFADMNFEGNYVHNKNGYVSIGGDQEIFFNKVRILALEVLKESGEMLFDRKVIVHQNTHIVLTHEHKAAPPYIGQYDKKDCLEVTYENGRDISFYNSQEKLKEGMDLMYKELLPQVKYEQFWADYQKRYFDLKARYKEAYQIREDW